MIHRHANKLLWVALLPVAVAFFALLQSPTASAQQPTPTPTPTPTPIAAPSISSLTPWGATGLRITWSAVAGATHYEVEEKADSLGYDWRVISTPQGTTITVGTFTLGVRYDFRVRGVSGLNKGPYSAAQSIIYTGAPAQPAPTWTSVEAIDYTGVALDWSDVANNYIYDLHYKRSSNSAWIELTQSSVSGSSARYEHGFAEGVAYDFRVRSRREDGTVSPWAETSFTMPTEPEPEPQPAPEWVSVSADGRGMVNLDWTDVDDNLVYDLAYKRSQNSQWLSLPQSGVTGSSARYSGFAHSDNPAENNYDFRVRSRREDGTTSGWVSTSYTIPEPTVLPLVVSVTAIGYSVALSSPYIGISYNSYEGATSYAVDIRSDGGSWVEVVSFGTYRFCSLSGVSRCVYGFAAETSYQVRVRAFDSTFTQITESDPASFRIPSIDDLTKFTPTPVPTGTPPPPTPTPDVRTATPVPTFTPTPWPRMRAPELFALSNSSMRISWANWSKSAYIIRYKQEGNDDWVYVTGQLCCQYVLTGLSEGHQIEAQTIFAGANWSPSGFGRVLGVTPTPTITPTPTNTPTATPTYTPGPVPSGFTLKWSDNSTKEPIVTSAHRASRAIQYKARFMSSLLGPNWNNTADIPYNIRYEYRVYIQSISLNMDVPYETNSTSLQFPYEYHCGSDATDRRATNAEQFKFTWIKQVCFGGLRSGETYFFSFRVTNTRLNNHTDWSDAWIFTTSESPREYEFLPTATPTFYPALPTRTPTGTPVPTPTLTSRDYDLSAPEVEYIAPGSAYRPGGGESNTLNVELIYTAPGAASDDDFNHYAIGVSASRGDASRREGHQSNCGRVTECALSYGNQTDSSGNIIADAYVLYFWLTAYWIIENGAPAPRTTSKATLFVNEVMRGKDARPGAEIIYPGIPNSEYQATGSVVHVLVDGLRDPDTLYARDYQTQLNHSPSYITNPAELGVANFDVELRQDEHFEAGFASVRTRGRIGPGAADGSDYVEIWDRPFKIPPYGYIYSQWDEGVRLAGGDGVSTPVPIPADVAPQEYQNVEAAVVSVAGLFFPETVREDDDIYRWKVLFCMAFALIGAAAVLWADYRIEKKVHTMAVFGAAALAYLIWIGGGLLFFELTIGMVAIPAVVPILLLIPIARRVFR